MIRKLLIGLLSATCVFGAAFGIAACVPDRPVEEDPDQSNEPPIYVEQNTGTVSALSFQINDAQSGYTVTGIRGNEVKSVQIPDSYTDPVTLKELPVTAIGDKAFSDEKGVLITSVSIGKNVAYIGSDAFSGCSALKLVTIPDSVTETGTGVFQNCTELVKVSLGKGLKTIAENMFGSCSKLTEIDLPQNITAINSNAFNGCTEIKEIKGCAGLTTIGDHAFSGCAGLKSLTLTGRNLRTFGEFAFADCTGLTTVDIAGNYVSEIGFNCFNNCNNIQKMRLPFVGKRRFTDMEDYKRQAYDRGGEEQPIVETLADEASGTSLSRQITTFGYIFGASASNENSQGQNYQFVPASLKSLTITGGLVIGANAFANMGELEYVEIGEGVEHIGRTVFAYDDKIATLVLGINVTDIGCDIFGTRTGGVTVYYGGESSSDWNGITFDMTGSNQNGAILHAVRYYFSDDDPAGDTSKTERNYWHRVNGNPTPW